MDTVPGWSGRRPRAGRAWSDAVEAGLSGRVFVTAMVLAVLVVWGSLFVAFRLWRSHYRERAEFGARVVASAIDPLASVVPPGVRADDWLEAVAETHAMLGTVSGSNLLDRDQMVALGKDVGDWVASARPETARDTLAKVWDEMENQAGPVVRDHHDRPGVLPPRRVGR